MRIKNKEKYEKIKSNISMENLKTIMENKGFSAVKIAVNYKISDRTDNPININDLNKSEEDKELNQLFQNIMSLPNEKRQLVITYLLIYEIKYISY